MSPSSSNRKLDVLARGCAAIGRPREEIETTVSTALFPDELPAAFADRCAVLGELSARHIGVITRSPWTDDDLARLVEGARLISG